MKKFLTYALITALITVNYTATADIDQQNMVGTTLVGAGALTTYMAIAGGAAAVIGTGGVALAAVGIAILIGNNTSDSSTLASEPISIRLNPNTPLITPSGWTDPVSPSIQPTPPTPIPKVGTWGAGAQTGYSTSQEAASAYAAANCSVGYVCTAQFHSITSSTLHKYTFLANGSPSGAINASLTLNCPAGYTSVGSECQLSSPELVKKPKKGVMEIKRVGNTFEIDPRINPADIIPPSIVNVESDKVTVNDSTGSKTITELKPDGTSTVTRQTPQPDGTTRTDVVNLSAPEPTTGNVTVTGTATNFVQGTGDLTGSELDLSSLNKEATQQAISNKLTQIKNGQCGGDGQPSCNVQIDESGNGDLSATGAQEALNAIDNQANEFTDLINQESAPVQDAGSTNNPLSSVNTASCQPLAIPAFGFFTGVSLDPCPVANAALPLVDWMFKVLAFIYVVFRFRSVTSGVPE